MPSKYTRSDRLKAAAAMVSYGNSLVVSNMTGIPGSTLRHWHRNDEEFQGMINEIRIEFGEQLKSKLAAIIDESADQTLDRLRNGDFVRDSKTGELVRVPVKGRDAALVGAICLDKYRLLENQPTSIVAKTDVSALAEQFRQLSEQWHEKQINVIDQDRTD